jgi:hypothetical protein
LSATATIVTIMGLVVAWCRLPPPSSSSLSSNAAATLPTTELFWYLSKKIHSHQISTDTQNSHLLRNTHIQHNTRLSPPPLPLRRCLRARQPPPPPLPPRRSPANDDDDKG